MKLSVVPHESWKDFFDRQDVRNAIADIETELDGATFYPSSANVLRFASTDLANVQYVLMGQDPYPSKDKRSLQPQATGRSFEVADLNREGWDCKIKQRSIHNILKAVYFTRTGKRATVSEIRKQIANGEFEIAPPAGWFDSLERQGVLFLNATLTVSPDEPGMHHLMWNDFRRLLVRYIIERNPGVEWVLWGKPVADMILPLLPSWVSVLRCCHPRRDEFIEGSTMSRMNVDWTGLS